MPDVRRGLGVERLQPNVVLDLGDTVREIRLAGLRSRLPDLTPRQIIARLVAEDYGIDLPSEE